MSKAIVAGVLVLFVGAAVVGSAAAAEGIEGLDAAWKKAVLAGDVAALAGLYDKDAVLCLPDVPEARGAEAIRHCYESILSANAVTSVEFSDTHYATSGNLSTGYGNFVMMLAPKAGGEPFRMAGRFTAVARNEGGKWAYVNDHVSLHPEGPAAHDHEH
jgi:ketosteroid isomerase-like protein